MGASNHKPLKYINFYFLEDCIHYKDTMLINTMSDELQQCLIIDTIAATTEEDAINGYIEEQKFNKIIVIYGKNSTDTTVEDKYKQLKHLGFKHVYVYRGGMFEWLLLQEIYGAAKFPTTCAEINMLKYA